MGRNPCSAADAHVGLMEAAALRNSGSGDTPYREFLISFSERFGAADSQALIVDVHTGIGDAQFSRNILPSQTPAFRDSIFRVFGWLAYRCEVCNHRFYRPRFSAS